MEGVIKNMGPQPLYKIMEAQKKIIDIMKRLRDEGSIQIKNTDDDPLV